MERGSPELQAVRDATGGHPTYEGRRKRHERRLAHAHCHAAQQQHGEAGGQAAAGGGRRPHSQAQADQAEGIVVLGGLSKDG
jgi:hypothetical protein